MQKKTILCWFGLSKYKYLVLFSSCLLFFSCKDSSENSYTGLSSIDRYSELPRDFKDFYSRFHSDSLFQLSRIDFPLRGLPAHAQEEDHSYEWEEENWVMHKLYEEGNKEYKRFWKLQNNQIIHEYIHSVHSDFGMQRTFKKRGSQWYLNYYAAMNRLY